MQKPETMSEVIDTLMEMGFSRDDAESAIIETGTLEIITLINWILSYNQKVETLNSETFPTGHSTSTDVNFTNLASANEVNEAFSQEDNKEQQTKMEEKSHETKAEKEILEARNRDDVKKRKLTEEQKHIIDNEKLARQRVKQQFKQDKLARKNQLREEKLKEKVNQMIENELRARQNVKQQFQQDKLATEAKFSAQPAKAPQVTTPLPASPKPASGYSEVTLQIRLLDGSSLVKKFRAKEPFSAVRLFVEINRKDGDEPFKLMTYPNKIFGPEDDNMSLEDLDLGPRTTLTLVKDLSK